MEGLALLGDARAAPALKRQLGDLADDVRVAAALALGKLRVADAVPAIAELTRRPPFEEISRQAALALGDIATPDAIAVLIEHLREPPVADEVAAGLLRAGSRGGAGAADRGAPRDRHQQRRGGHPARPAARRQRGRGPRGRGAAHRDRRPARRGKRNRAASIGAMAAIKDPESVPALLRRRDRPAGRDPARLLPRADRDRRRARARDPRARPRRSRRAGARARVAPGRDASDNPLPRR